MPRGIHYEKIAGHFMMDKPSYELLDKLYNSVNSKSQTETDPDKVKDTMKFFQVLSSYKA